MSQFSPQNITPPTSASSLALLNTFTVQGLSLADLNNLRTQLDQKKSTSQLESSFKLPFDSTRVRAPSLSKLQLNIQHPKKKKAVAFNDRYDILESPKQNSIQVSTERSIFAQTQKGILIKNRKYSESVDEPRESLKLGNQHEITQNHHDTMSWNPLPKD